MISPLLLTEAARGDVAALDRLGALLEHRGPGPHPSGSLQSVHAGGGGGAALPQVHLDDGFFAVDPDWPPSGTGKRDVKVGVRRPNSVSGATIEVRAWPDGRRSIEKTVQREEGVTRAAMELSVRSLALLIGAGDVTPRVAVEDEGRMVVGEVLPGKTILHALQDAAPGTIPPLEAAKTPTGWRTLTQIAFLDFVLDNRDRHWGNILLDQDAKGGPVFRGVDHDILGPAEDWTTMGSRRREADGIIDPMIAGRSVAIPDPPSSVPVSLRLLAMYHNRGVEFKVPKITKDDFDAVVVSYFPIPEEPRAQVQLERWRRSAWQRYRYVMETGVLPIQPHGNVRITDMNDYARDDGDGTPEG